MEVKLSPTPEQEAFIRAGIKTGRFRSPDDAAREALLQWNERERRRSELLLELDAAEVSLARGEGRRLTKRSIQGLIEGVKKQGRSRPASDR